MYMRNFGDFCIKVFSMEICCFFTLITLSQCSKGKIILPQCVCYEMLWKCLSFHRRFNTGK